MSVNKVQLANGETIIDISDSTVTPETLAEGVTAHDASGQKITGKMVPGGGSSVQSDWNQTDETAPDFLKNKPFGDELVEIMSKTEVTAVYEDGVNMIFLDVSLFTGNERRLSIVFDGIEYVCDAQSGPEGSLVFGNYGMFGGIDTGEPFMLIVMVSRDMAHIAVTDTNVHTLSIGRYDIKRIDVKYMPSTVILYADSQNFLYTDSDTSDINKRMTKIELSTIFFSGVLIYLCYSTTEYIYKICDLVQLHDGAAYGRIRAGEREYHTREAATQT